MYQDIVRKLILSDISTSSRVLKEVRPDPKDHKELREKPETTEPMVRTELLENKEILDLKENLVTLSFPNC